MPEPTTAEPQPSIAELMEQVNLDLLDPIPPSQWSAMWPWLLSAAIVLVVAAVIAIWVIRRKPQPAPIPPMMLAHSRLSRLQVTSDGMNGAEFTHAIASIVRDYLSDCAVAPASRMTAGELADALASGSLAAETRERITTLLGDCDLCRFANTEVDGETRQRLSAEAAAIIESIEASRQPES